ncbi:MAG: O-antigen ligase family protein [Terriglobia bacterium]
MAQARVALYVRSTPLLWAIGLLIPVGMGLTALLAFGKRWREVFGTPLLWVWWAVGSFQAMSTILNWAGSTHDIAFLAHRLASAIVIGWFLLGLALAVGCAYDLASSQLIRSVAQLGPALLALALLSIVTFFLTGQDSLEILTPVGYLFPRGIQGVSNSFTMHLFASENLGGVRILRLALFYPWAVMTGFAGIAVFFISLHDKEKKWRILGMTGGLVALAGSGSRAAIGTFLIGCVVFQLLRLRFFDRAVVALAGICILFLAVQLIGVRALRDLPGALSSRINSVRQDSSDSRMNSYEESWNAFLRSPVIGYGWDGRDVSGEVTAIGTHSTIYGVLYTGGLLTFVPLCFALLVTSIAVFTKSGTNAAVHRSAVVIMLSLIALLYSEAIASFVAPTLFSFWWIGGAIRGKKAAVIQPVIRVIAVDPARRPAWGRVFSCQR